MHDGRRQLEGKDMMRDNQALHGPGPGGFSLSTTLHSVPSVQRHAPEAWFGVPVYTEKPRLHLVNPSVRPA